MQFKAEFLVKGITRARAILRAQITLSIAVSIGMAIALTGCAKVAHKEFSEEQVGLALLKEEAVRKVVFGEEVQSYVSRYPLFADVVNTEILRDLGGYVGKYNVYAREPITYAETGLTDIDPFLQRATRVSATVRVGTRLMNYIGKRLVNLNKMNDVSRSSDEIYFAMTPEEFSKAVESIREVKGRLSKEQKREIARDIVALASDMEAVGEAVGQAKGLQTEGENIKKLVGSSSYGAELQARDGGRAKLLPEIISNVNGAIAAVKTAETDGEALTRNARAWKIYLADALQ